MSKLPKRTDEIYNEIENFKDYEFTNCIVYEMIQRNSSFIKKRNEIYNLNKKIKKLHINCINKYLQKLTKKTNVNSEYPTKECYMELNKNFDHSERLKIKDCQKLQECKNEIQNISKYVKDNFGLVPISKKADDMERKIIKRNQSVTNIILKLKNMNSNKSIQIPQDMKFQDSKPKNNTYIENYANLIYSRPILKFTSMQLVHIELNLRLSEQELLAQIKQIKKNYIKENIAIRTIEDIFNIDDKTILQDNIKNKSLRYKKIADHFFIYDYVVARQKTIEKSNTQIRQENNYKMKEVDSSHLFNGKDKEIQIKELKKELNNNLINTTLEDILKEKTINQTFSTAKRYYFSLKNSIKDLEFKKLIA